MTRSKSSGALARPAYDVLVDVEKTYACTVLLEMEPTDRVGVFLLSFSANLFNPQTGYKKVSGYAIEWPNAQDRSLEAELFHAANLFARHASDDLARRGIEVAQRSKPKPSGS